MSNITAQGTGVVVPVDFTSRDFNSISNDLINGIPSFIPNWTGTSSNDFGIALLQLFAFMGDIQNYYIDRVANEAFLATAQQMSSVLNLAYLIDYAPQGASPSTTTMSITLAAGSPSFDLPAGSQFSTQPSSTADSMVFETNSDHTIPANTGTGPMTITATTENGVSTPLAVVQGVTITSESLGTSDGSANQQYTLFNTGVIESSVQVFVDDGNGPVPWTMVTHLTDAGPYDPDFMLTMDATGVVYVNFGDGNNGIIPSSGYVITATYRVGGGAITNVGANQINVSLVTNNSPDVGPYIVSVTNPSPAVGGSDAETMTQIQNNAPQSITAAGRCVSLQDYATVALQVPGVSKTNSVLLAPSSVGLYVHPAGGPYSAATLQAMVTALAPSITYGGAGGSNSTTNASGYLDSRKMAGTTVTVLPPTTDGAVGYVQVVLDINLQVLPQYQQATVVSNVQTAISNLLDFGSVNFGQRITLSSIYSVCNAVAGVDYLVITQMYRSDGTAGTPGDIVCGPTEIPVITDPDNTTSQVTITPTGGL